MKPPVHAHRILELLERHGASGWTRQPPREKRPVKAAVKAMRDGEDRRGQSERTRRRRRSS